MPIEGAPIPSCLTRAAGVLLALAVLCAMPLAPAVGQEEPSGTSYLTPFPEGDTYKLQVYGDAFAEGLLGGLTESFAGDNRVQVSAKHRTLNGIARAEFADDAKVEEASHDTFHIGVVMVGFYDRINMRMTPRDRLLFGSEEWREEYGRRVDRLIKALKRRGLALYWVSLPIMRRFEANDPAQMMNDIVRSKAYLDGIKFIDIGAQFADEAGNYTAYGPDITGKQRLLREADGILLTPAGNRKLAHFVAQEIKRDLTTAKNERAIPLAGNEAEQKRVAALRPRPATEGDGGWKGSVAASKEAVGKKTAPAPPADTTNEQKADNGRITLKSVGVGGREESVTIDLPRPPIPAAVVSLVTRKESTDRPSAMGDVLSDDVGGGLVVLDSITPTSVGTGPAQRRLAPSQTPYYHVLVKGERPPPKPGRADDFSWPKTEPEMASEPAAPERRLSRPPTARVSPRS
jgi:uncharacterized protein